MYMSEGVTAFAWPLWLKTETTKKTLLLSLRPYPLQLKFVTIVLPCEVYLNIRTRLAPLRIGRMHNTTHVVTVPVIPIASRLEIELMNHIESLHGPEWRQP